MARPTVSRKVSRKLTSKPKRVPKAAPRKQPSKPHSGRAASLLAAQLVVLPGLTVPVSELDWFTLLDGDLKLAAGTPAPTPLRVPAADANRMLAATVRLVADIPRGAPGSVVWVRGDAELAVRTDGIRIACAPGVVTISLPVSCEQWPKEAIVSVPIGVGSEERMAGLVMSTFARPLGPEVVTALWSEALAAFAWEALVHLAQQICAAVGKDRNGRALVPSSIAAGRAVLLLQPMARHELSGRTSS